MLDIYSLLWNLVYYGGFVCLICGAIVFNKVKFPVKIIGGLMIIIGGVAAIWSNKQLSPDNQLQSTLTILIVCFTIFASLFMYAKKGVNE